MGQKSAKINKYDNNFKSSQVASIYDIHLVVSG